jgi:hypothetical protein
MRLVRGKLLPLNATICAGYGRIGIQAMGMLLDLIFSTNI